MRRAGLRKGVLAVVLLVVLGGLGLGPRDDAEAVHGTATSGAKVVRELIQLRTENSKTFLLSDGRRQAVIYAGPIHYRDKAGTWRQIDTTLIPSEKPGEFRSRLTPVAVRISSEGSPAVFVTYQGYTLSMTLVGAESPLLVPTPATSAPEGPDPGPSVPTGSTAVAEQAVPEETTTSQATAGPTSESANTTAETSSTGTLAPGRTGSQPPPPLRPQS